MAMLRTGTIYRRCASALILPLAFALLFRTEFFEHLGYLMLRSDLLTWLGIAAAVGLVVLEWAYLATLARFVLVKGDVVAFNALRNHPLQRARTRRRRFRAATVVLSFAVGFGAAEILFRLLDIRPAPALRPSHFDILRVDNTRNALGLREEWDFIPPGDPRLRIAFLGDSFTYGDSVDPHETFCHLLEGMLAPDWPTGVITINMGGIGTAPGTQYDTYMSLRDELSPDVLVQVIYLNDLGIDLRSLLVKIHGITKAESWLATQSYVWRYAETQFRYLMAWHGTLDYFRGGRNRAEREHSWSVFKRDVVRCKETAEQSGARYGLVLFPWLFQLEKYPLKEVHAKMRAFASELGVPYLDLLEAFEGRDGEDLCVSPVNEHPSPTAHRIAAERIARFLREDVFPSLPATEESPRTLSKRRRD
jgi:hypothetical protein